MNAGRMVKPSLQIISATSIKGPDSQEQVRVEKEEGVPGSEHQFGGTHQMTGRALGKGLGADPEAPASRAAQCSWSEPERGKENQSYEIQTAAKVPGNGDSFLHSLRKHYQSETNFTGNHKLISSNLQIIKPPKK